jgi:hypothetical protein
VAIPPHVLKYQQNTGVDVFYFTRVFRKRKQKGENEFLVVSTFQ